MPMLLVYFSFLVSNLAMVLLVPNGYVQSACSVLAIIWAFMLAGAVMQEDWTS